MTCAILGAMMLLQLPVAQAQYPSVPPEIAAASEAMIARAKQRSDSIFASFKEIREKDAAQGRPYVPCARRPEDLVKANIPAFPGAEGGAMWTPGGRGGKVLTVTNLNDDGEGSFRWACEQGGARIVVFNVAGIIRLKTPLIVKSPYITIAGQTAPGDGVCVAGESVWIDTHDVVIRHMRFRRGETNVGRRDDCIGGNPIGNIMLDHLSCSWGLDENISFYRYMYQPENGGPAQKLMTVNVTIQNSISSQGLDTYNHSFGSTIGGINNTFARNIWANNTGRNPSMSSSEFNYLNNIIYNWYHRTGDGSGFSYNVFNNYFKPGPVTPKDEPIAYRVFRANGRGRTPHWAYVEGNIVEGNEKVTKNNWDGGVQDGHSEEDLAFIRSDKMKEMAPVTIMTAKEAYKFVLANAGALYPKRDIVDQRVIHQIQTDEVYYDPKADEIDYYQFQYRRLPQDSYKKGIITDISQVGGYPEYKGTPYVDTDKDGMPDAWEKKYGLNPNDPSDAVKDCNGDGYTNIEKYINAINPKKKVDWSNLKNNYDTLTKAKGQLMK
ncbi:MAG: polysaccharide lyase [Bacteroidales bacterium]|nr:polysaccharide lyase [Bacteroidales bacterium]